MMASAHRRRHEQWQALLDMVDARNSDERRRVQTITAWVQL